MNASTLPNDRGLFWVSRFWSLERFLKPATWLSFLALLSVQCTTYTLPDAKAAPLSKESSNACESALSLVSHETSVPLPLLKAIALTETGRMQQGDFKPWPWSLNHHGKSHIFSSQEEMRTHVQHLLARGITRFDVGCMQIHWHHHHRLVNNPYALLDPFTNARVAALLMLKHYQRFKSWAYAAGAYHSQNPKPMKRYLAQIQTHWGKI